MPSAISQILVIGSLNVDLVTRVPRLPAPGETVIGGTFHTAAGGKGANQAVASARMGAPVAMIGRVGDDMFGAMARAELTRAGVDITHVRTDADAATGTGQIVIDAAGQNSIAVASGANARLSPADIDSAAAVWERAAVLVLQLEIPLDTNAAAIARATALGIPVILNAAPAASFDDELRRAVSWLIVNEIEAAQRLRQPVSSIDEAMAAAAALGRLTPHVVVTLGAQGAVFTAGDSPRHVPAPPVAVVDTTAAGDAFVGALAAALWRGESDDAALRAAVVAGSLACTKLGAIPSLPTIDELRNFRTSSL
ncbi:MAG: ribokinase [Deltaproteobacteria bacterium]|nr:ribokinase [Deltaproteobacteria bacterium]MBI3388895.1 ribokinase [Deltaproteobacteria bacterium]